jgi:hypothetical protein
VRVTVNLPGVTPELLDLGASYLGKASRADLLRSIIMDMVEVIEEDAIPGPDGECIGSVWDSEDELFPKVVDCDMTREIEALRAEVARLRAELRERDGEGWKAGQPEDGEE